MQRSSDNRTKYGFVYVFFDRRHRRFYIGCHWGREDDGYICSSRWMRQSYRRRPHDFKRRILKTNIVCRRQMLEEEYRWLSLIKNEELGKRYYNLSKKHFGHWATDEQKRLNVGQKISASPNRNANIGKANKEKYKDGLLEETKKKISISTKEAMTNLSEEKKEKIRQAGIDTCEKRWSNNQGNKHGYRGVYFQSGKYIARSGKKYIGSFNTAKEAGEVVKEYKWLQKQLS